MRLVQCSLALAAPPPPPPPGPRHVPSDFSSLGVELSVWQPCRRTAMGQPSASLMLALTLQLYIHTQQVGGVSGERPGLLNTFRMKMVQLIIC